MSTESPQSFRFRVVLLCETVIDVRFIGVPLAALVTQVTHSVDVDDSLIGIDQASGELTLLGDVTFPPMGHPQPEDTRLTHSYPVAVRGFAIVGRGGGQRVGGQELRRVSVYPDASPTLKVGPLGDVQVVVETDLEKPTCARCHRPYEPTSVQDLDAVIRSGGRCPDCQEAAP